MAQGEVHLVERRACGHGLTVAGVEPEDLPVDVTGCGSCVWRPTTSFTGSPCVTRQLPTPRRRDGAAISAPSAASAQTASDAAHEGVAPTERHVWSPEVSEPADLVRSIEELMESGPIDVIALQEVDRAQDRTAGVDQARLVAETIGAKYWRFVPSVRGTPGIASEGAAWVPATDADDLPADQCEPETPTGSGPRYGIALISRYPVRGWRVMRFPPAPVSMPLLAPTGAADPRRSGSPTSPVRPSRASSSCPTPT